LRAIAIGLGLVLAVAALLERWPSRRDGPAFGPSVTLDDGRTVFPEGPLLWKDGLFELAPGATTLLVRSSGAPGSLALLAGGTGLLEPPGGGRVALRPEGVVLRLPLEEAAVVSGRGGGRETLSRLVLRVKGSPMTLRLRDVAALAAPPPASPETGELAPPEVR
jgi:hypothetical protein